MIRRPRHRLISGPACFLIVNVSGSIYCKLRLNRYRCFGMHWYPGEVMTQATGCGHMGDNLKGVAAVRRTLRCGPISNRALHVQDLARIATSRCCAFLGFPRYLRVCLHLFSAFTTNTFTVLPFFFPAELILGRRGSGGGEEPSGEKVLRLIQIRLMCAVYAKTVRISSSQTLPNFHIGPRPTSGQSACLR